MCELYSVQLVCQQLVFSNILYHFSMHVCYPRADLVQEIREFNTDLIQTQVLIK